MEHGTTSSRTQSDDTVEHGGDTVTVLVGTLPDGCGFYVEDDGGARFEIVGIPVE
ncbi:MAG: hypothetical protein ABEH86_13890 [Haloarcula sp.]